MTLWAFLKPYAVDAIEYLGVPAAALIVGVWLAKAFF